MEKQTLLKLLFSGFFIVTLLFAGYYKTEMARKNNIIAHIEADKSCDLQHNACTLKIPGGAEITLEIEPRPIPLVQKFDIKVTTNKLEAQVVSVDFKGVSMDMGPNNVTLKAQNSAFYSGQGMLPVCIRNTMEWQANVYIQTPDGIYIAPYTFVTQH